jgi:hypothetical protein
MQYCESNNQSLNYNISPTTMIVCL